MQSGRIASLALALAGISIVLSGAGCHADGAAVARARSSTADASCPPGARLGPAGCACRADLRLLLGACVPLSTAAAYCGPTAAPTADDCVLRPACERGRARELGSGECLARREVRDLAASLGILVADDELLGCPAGDELAAVTADRDERALRLGCLPRVAPVMASHDCPAGTLPPRCAPVIGRGATGGRPEIDVARWVEAAIGPDGGAGAPPLCSAWARAPSFLGSAAPTEARFAITLVFADNDVSLVVADVRAADPNAATELDRALHPIVEALRALGGTASQATVTTTVRCVRRAPGGGARPSSLPAENDHES